LRSVAVGSGGKLSTYREFAPPVLLADAVACTWTGQPGWARPLRVLPDGCLDIAWDGRRLQAVLAVPGTSRHLLEPDSDIIGLRVCPGWAAAVLGTPVDELPPVAELREITAGPVQRVEQALAAAATSSQRRSVLTSLVAQRLTSGAHPDRRVLAATRHFARSETSVGRAVEAVGLSARQLRRRFHEDIGLAPQEFRGIARLRRFLMVTQDPDSTRDLAGTAFACGYADQSHLARECRRWTGSTPGDLAAPRRLG
jgi:AraC-like DNA-binding protein